METMDVFQHIISHELNSLNYSLAIIPTVLIPLTGLAVILSSVATIIASWFGIKLKTEGPKQLLEVLLTKKVLISAVLLNFLFWGLAKAYTYAKNSAVPLTYISYQTKGMAKASTTSYENSPTRAHTFYVSESKPTSLNTIAEKWIIKLPKGAFRSMTPSSQSLFVGVDDGKVYDINALDGSINRTFYVGTQVTTRPVIFNDKIYVGEGNHETHHARVYSYDLKTGLYLNAFQTKGHTEGQPIIASYNQELSMFVTAGKDGLYAIDPETMKIKWHNYDGHLDATASVEDNKVFTGSGKEKGLAFDRSYATVYDFNSGKVIWKKELPLSNWMHPLITNEFACYVLGEIYTESNVGLFYCFNKNSGNVAFSLPFNAPLVGKPLLLKTKTKEIAYVSSFSGEVCAIDIAMKVTSWCFNAGTPKTKYALSSVSYDTKRHLIWYASADNGLFALNPLDGQLIKHWVPEENSLTPWKKTLASVSIVDDSLFLVDLKGFVRRLDLN